METLGVYGKKAIASRLDQWNLANKKRWGQNFLCEKNVSQKIAETIYACLDGGIEEREGVHESECANTNSITEIWEIGPGLGALTEALYEYDLARGQKRTRESQTRSFFTLFEIDYGIIEMLEYYIKTLSLENSHALVAGDAEKSLISHIQNGGSTPPSIPDVICGNLPYSSGVRILLSCSQVRAHALEAHNASNNAENSAFSSRNISGNMSTLSNIPIYAMLQKEAAERLVAGPNSKAYGVSTVLLSIMYDIKILYPVSRSCFFPVPNVESVMCSFLPRRDRSLYTIKQYSIFRKLVSVSFSQRRKKLRNTLGLYLSHLKEMHSDGTKQNEPQDIALHDKDKNIDYMDLAEKVGIDMGLRAENISTDLYMSLAKKILMHK